MCFVLELPSNFYVILLSSFGQGRSIVEEKLDFKGGNVHVITTKEDWDQKIEEANKDGKIVSKLAICYSGLQISFASYSVWYKLLGVYVYQLHHI